MSSGDVRLQHHLGNAPANCRYTSPDIQNQVIDILGDHVQAKILSSVRRLTSSPYWQTKSPTALTRSSLALFLGMSILRISKFVKISFSSLSVIPVLLAQKISAFIESHGLDLNKLRGQGYDGVGNMSGKTNGAAAVISSDYPLAIYLHCASHTLNLAVVKSLDVQCVRNMIGVVNRVSTFFFAHPKRQRKLEEAIQTTQPTSSVLKLKDLCRTRWIERIDALDRFKDLHASIVACFESISAEGSRNWTSDSLTDASTLLLAITTTDFLGALVIANKCLNYLLALTRSLQAEAKDIVVAVREVDNLKDVLSDVRRNVDVYHGQWFAGVEKMCDSVGIQPSLPSLCARQSHHCNVPSQNPSEYYSCNSSIRSPSVRDGISVHQKTVLLGLYLIPLIFVTKNFEEIVEKLGPLAKMYASDLKDDTFQNELHQWYLKWEKEKKNSMEYKLFQPAYLIPCLMLHPIMPTSVFF